MLSIDITNEKEYNYVYEDGVIVRSTECDITVNGEVITNRFPVNTIIYTYNGGALVKKRIIPENGFDTEQVYTYPNDNGNTASCTFVRGDTTVTATSVTDGLGRAVSESITAGNVTISRAFTYTDGVAPLTGAPLDTNEYKPTTQLVSKMELSDGTALDYEYDACGRITKVTETRNGTATVTEYTYDALGQLLTETVNGTPVNCMSYDSYGNIQEKNGVSYSYDSTWKDRLTSVGDHSVTYGSDPCNPATYFGNSLVWEKGRQLKQFGNYTYKYNANGIRTRKTVNNINHFYFLDGTKILREKWGEDDIVPIYDTNESVIGLTHSTESGTNTYYFLKNLQGDIIAITDASGTVIARYKYDAWGKVLSVTDANGNSITSPFDIANVNPFRYRGYYYDTETGLYYLQSRYYDPGVGRFLNADEIEFVSIDQTLLGKNLFAYCKNDPANQTEFLGNALLTIVLKCVFGAIFGLLVQLLCDFLEYAAKKYLLNKNVADAFSPTSPSGDYIGSAVAWALNTLSLNSELAMILVPLIPVASKHIINAINRKFKLRDFLVDLGYALITGIVSVALTSAASKQLSELRKYRKKNSRNLELKAQKKAIKFDLNLKLTKVSITFTSLDAITILILNILLG